MVKYGRSKLNLTEFCFILKFLVGGTGRIRTCDHVINSDIEVSMT